MPTAIHRRKIRYTREKLSKFISETTGISTPDCRLVLDATITAIVAQLLAGERVTIKGFGTFKVVLRNARLGRVPAKGHYSPDVFVEIPAHNSVTFKPVKELSRMSLIR